MNNKLVEWYISSPLGDSTWKTTGLAILVFFLFYGRRLKKWNQLEFYVKFAIVVSIFAITVLLYVSILETVTNSTIGN